MPDISGFRALQDEAEYQTALETVRAYFDNEPDTDTPEADEFDALVLMIEQYESRHYPMQRIARKIEDLDEPTLRAIAESEVPSEFAYLDHLIKDWTP
ncbi:hypothetical protein [Rhizobium sp.]